MSNNKPLLNWFAFLLSATLCLYSAVARSQADTAALGNDAHLCSISVSTKQPEYGSGEPISLTINFKNVGNADLTVARGGFAHYDVIVLFGDEEHVPLTSYGKKTLGRTQGAGAGSLATVTLKPGEQTSMEIPLSRLFDFSLAGNYEVAVSRTVKMPDTNAWITVTSNQIEISVDDSFTTRIIK